MIVNNYSTSAGLDTGVGYNHLISNKRESNNCFIKYAHKISKNLPDFILFDQTGKDKVLPLFTCHTSIKTVIAQADWTNEKSIHYYTFKNTSAFLDCTQQDS